MGSYVLLTEVEEAMIAKTFPSDKSRNGSVNPFSGLSHEVSEAGEIWYKSSGSGTAKEGTYYEAEPTEVAKNNNNDQQRAKSEGRKTVRERGENDELKLG